MMCFCSCCFWVCLGISVEYCFQLTLRKRIFLGSLCGRRVYFFLFKDQITKALLSWYYIRHRWLDEHEYAKHLNKEVITMTGSQVSVFVCLCLLLYLCICIVPLRARVCVCLRLPCKALQQPGKEPDRNEPVTMVMAHLPYRSALPRRLDRCQRCQLRNTHHCPLQRCGQSHSFPGICLVTSLAPSASLCHLQVPRHCCGQS